MLGLPGLLRQDLRFGSTTNATDEDVWTLVVHAPGCVIEVMTNEGQEPPDRKRVTLPGVHIQCAPERDRLANLWLVAARFSEEAGCDELVIEGASRTTGANPRRPPITSGSSAGSTCRRPRASLN